MPTPDPKSYAHQWVRAWNAHDIEAVLDHFHDDVVFTSPVAARCGARKRGSGARQGSVA
jgi:ketosteroid isomerase-like protein